MAITNAEFIPTVFCFFFTYLCYMLIKGAWQHHSRWWTWLQDSMESILDYCLFKYLTEYADNSVKLTMLTEVQQYTAIFLTVIFVFGWSTLGTLRVGFHTCEYPIIRPYTEPFGFCIQPNIVPETAMPWYGRMWVEQTEGAEVTPIQLYYTEPIFIGDLQMNVIRESLRFRAEKLPSLLPDDSEARNLTQLLHKIVTEMGPMQSDWERFGFDFSIGKDLINYQLRIFLEMYITLVSQKHYPMWSSSVILCPVYHVVGILHRMTRGPLGPEPWLYDLEVATEMRYRSKLIAKAVNELWEKLDQQSRQSSLIEVARTRIARELQRVEEAQSHTSWTEFLSTSKEAKELARYQNHLEQIQDCLDRAWALMADWRTSHTKLMNFLLSLKDSMIPITWNEVSPFRPSSILLWPAGCSNASQSTSTQVPDPLTTTHGKNSETLSPLDKLFTFKLARLGSAELSNAISDVISVCKSGDFYGDSKESLYPICTIYQSLSILSEIDDAALTDRPKTWLQSRGTARDEFERQNFGTSVTSEQIKRLSEQNWH